MGKAELPLHAPGTKVDRGYIGESVPRPNVQRLLQGRGAFIDDLRFPRLAHVAFFRSPYAHARIKRLDFSKALKQPGIIGVFDGRAVADIVQGRHFDGFVPAGRHVLTASAVPATYFRPPTSIPLTVGRGHMYVFTAVWDSDVVVLRPL